MQKSGIQHLSAIDVSGPPGPSDRLSVIARRLLQLMVFVLVVVGSALQAAPIEISGSIDEDTTLVQGATYHVTGALTVTEDVTLTIPHGTVLKSDSTVWIRVDGALQVNGTETDPVYFTEVRDSSVGLEIEPGDPQPGSWRYVEVRDGGEAVLDHLHVRYASNFSYPRSIWVRSGGLLTLRDSSISEGRRVGIEISGGSEDHIIERTVVETHVEQGIVLSGTSGAIELNDNTVRDNDSHGLRLTNVTGSPVFEGNELINNGGYGLSIVDQPLMTGLVGNTVTGNSSGPVFLNPNASATVVPLDNDLDGPVWLGSGTLDVDTTWNNLRDYYYQGGFFTVAEGATLTVPAGVVIKSTSATTAYRVDGVLSVEGTAADPVYFTDYRDDTVGEWSEPGDLEPGRWRYIQVRDGGEAILDHLHVRYASNFNNPRSIWVRSGGLLTLRDSVISEGRRVGIEISGGSEDHIIERTVVETHVEQGIVLSGTSGAIELNDNTVRDNDSHGLRLTNVTGSPVFEGNELINNGGYGLSIVDQPFMNGLVGNTLTGNSSGPVFLNPNASATVVPLDNTLDGPVWLGSGTLEVDTTWNNLRDYYYQGGIFTVAEGTTLTVPDGVVVKSASSTTQYRVDGVLSVEGTDADPVYFTDYRDDTVGEWSEPGDLEPGRWRYIQVRDGGEAILDHLHVRYASNFNNPRSIWVRSGGLLTLRDSVISEGRRVGIEISGGSEDHIIERTIVETHQEEGIVLSATSGSIQLTDNTVRDNGSHGLELSNVTGPVSLANNQITNGGGHGIVISGSGLPESPNGSSPLIGISGNRISTQSQDGLRIVDSQVFVERNRVFDNQGIGISLDGEATIPDVFGNWVSSNAGGGIDASDQANPLVGGTRDTGNDIAGNSDFGIRNQTAEGVVIQARCNWWGHESGPFEPNENPQGQGNAIEGPGGVEFLDFLDKSAIDGVFRDRFQWLDGERDNGC